MPRRRQGKRFQAASGRRRPRKRVHTDAFVKFSSNFGAVANRRNAFCRQKERLDLAFGSCRGGVPSFAGGEAREPAGEGAVEGLSERRGGVCVSIIEL